MLLRARIASLLLSILILLLAGCESPSAPPATTQPTGSTTSQATPTPSPTFTSTLQHLHLPPGFQVSMYASGLHAPRFITMGPNGVLLVADRGSGSIIAYRSEERRVGKE